MASVSGKTASGLEHELSIFEGRKLNLQEICANFCFFLSSDTRVLFRGAAPRRCKACMWGPPAPCLVGWLSSPLLQCAGASANLWRQIANGNPQGASSQEVRGY